MLGSAKNIGRVEITMLRMPAEKRTGHGHTVLLLFPIQFPLARSIQAAGETRGSTMQNQVETPTKA